METKKCVHGKDGGDCSMCRFLIKKIDALHGALKHDPMPEKKCGHGRNPDWCTEERRNLIVALVQSEVDAAVRATKAPFADMKKDRKVIMAKPKKKFRTGCWFCGAEMIWGGDHSFEDYGIDDKAEDGIVANMSCSNKKCGATAEFYSKATE